MAKRKKESYHFGMRGPFSSLSLAKFKAKGAANANNKIIEIENSSGRVVARIYPKSTNPLPRGKWVHGKVRVTSSGKIEFKKGR
jgi:hypothetical protein